MNLKNIGVLLVVCGLAEPLTAQAQELLFSVGRTDFSDKGKDGAVFDFEYRHSPFSEKPIRSIAFGANASASAEGDVFIGGGLWARWKWSNGWFIDTSLMPGLFKEGTDGNDLGTAFAIRSLIGAGYEFHGGHKISAAIAHKSNAGLANSNPGTNTFSIRYHVSF